MSELLDAVYRRDDARVAELLAAGPELDLFEAAAVGDIGRVRERLAADPAAAASWSEDGFTGLHLAAFFRHPEVARLLVEHGAPVDVLSRNEQIRVTPLGSAAAAGQAETAALLLERGADANVPQEGGFTPLHAAAAGGHEALVAVLLGHGGDPALAADDGRRAADFARDAGHADLAARLASG